MTYKQKLEDQIEFAKKKMAEADEREARAEVHTWSGYIQGLRYALSEYVVDVQQNEIIGEAQPVTGFAGPTLVPRQCTCDEQDLRPLGECICGASKVAPV